MKPDSSTIKLSARHTIRWLSKGFIDLLSSTTYVCIFQCYE